MLDAYGPPATAEGRRIAALHEGLVAVGAITGRAARPAYIRADLLAGEEWVALEELLCSVWPPDAAPAELLAEAAATALETAGGTWSVGEPDETPSPEEFVRRCVELPPQDG